MKDLTLIMPAKNELPCMDYVLSGLEKINSDINVLIVVDNEDDNTLQTSTSKYNLNIDFFVTNIPGFGNAIKIAINKVRTKYACVFNADGSFDPGSLNLMYSKINEYDYIFCSRYQKGGYSDDDTYLTYIGNFFFTNLSKILFKSNISDILYFYFLAHTNELKKLTLTSTDYCVALEIPLKAVINKNKILCLPSHERSRFSGKKKVREFVDGFKLLKYLIRFYISQT